MSGVTGRRALVTGGASGIGLATARRLVREGCEVAVLDLPGPNLDAASSVVQAVVGADVRRADEVRHAVDEARAELGGLDTLVLCAGIIHIKPLAEVSEDDWDRTLAVNLKGAFLCAQAAAPALCDGGRGRIVAISSDAGRRGVPYLHAYSASKFGLIGLIQSLAGELAPRATANAICPVSTPGTGMGQQVLSWKSQVTGHSPGQVLDEIANAFPLARTGSEEDIAGCVTFLISDEASFITGTAIDVDGGAALNTMPGVSL